MALFDEYPDSLNDLPNWRQRKCTVGRGEYRLRQGTVVNVKDHHHITQHYDIQVTGLDLGGRPIILPECRRGVNSSGYDGVGDFEPLEENTPVILLMVEGVASDAFIMGTGYLSGDFTDFLLKGEASPPNSYYDGFQGKRQTNQPSVYPTRIAQPDSVTYIRGTTTRGDGFDDPKYHDTIEDQVKARRQIGSVEIHTPGGDSVFYNTGTFGVYSDKDILLFSKGTNESKCTRLMRHAAYYTSMYKLIRKYLGIEDVEENAEDSENEETSSEQTPDSKTEEEAAADQKLESKSPELQALADIVGSALKTSVKETKGAIKSKSGGTVLVSPYNLSPKLQGGINFGEALPIEYHLDQVYKLSQAYRQAAQNCGQAAAVNSQVANTKVDRAETKPAEEESNISGQTDSAIPTEGFNVEDDKWNFSGNQDDTFRFAAAQSLSRNGEQVNPNSEKVQEGWTSVRGNRNLEKREGAIVLEVEREDEVYFVSAEKIDKDNIEQSLVMNPNTGQLERLGNTTIRGYRYRE